MTNFYWLVTSPNSANSAMPRHARLSPHSVSDRKNSNCDHLSPFYPTKALTISFVSRKPQIFCSVNFWRKETHRRSVSTPNPRVRYPRPFIHLLILLSSRCTDRPYNQKMNIKDSCNDKKHFLVKLSKWNCTLLSSGTLCHGPRGWGWKGEVEDIRIKDNVRVKMTIFSNPGSLVLGQVMTSIERAASLVLQNYLGAST